MRTFYFISILFSIILIIESKQLFSELLTNDNELLLIETHTSSSSSSKKDSHHKIQKLVEDTTIKSKIVVNVLYKNKNQNNRNEFKNLASNKTQKNIIYLNSNKLTSCDKNVCKSNETCVLKASFQDGAKDYQCIPKLKNYNNKKSLVSNKSNKTNINHVKNNNRNLKTLSQSIKCSNQTLSNLKITLFEIFQRTSKEFSMRKELISKSSNKFCLKTVLNSFAKLDLNMNMKLSLLEWSKLEVTNLDSCALEFFNKCDHDHDHDLSIEELCDCFDSSQHKCKSIRNSANSNDLNSYIKTIEKAFSGKFSSKSKLSNKSYIPVCDSSGYFKSMQCDKLVNCWCVDKEGNPIVNTFRKIDDDPISCYNNRN